MKYTLGDLLNECIKVKGTDLHIIVDSPPQIRVDGSLKPLKEYGIVDPDQAKELCYSVLTPEQQAKFESELELDLSFSFENKGRIRTNVYWQQGSISGAFRVIPMEIPSLEELGLPDIIMKMADKPRGLVLVTGPTGCGKSTTLATMLNRINETRRDHIITIEDPIEYLYRHKKCMVDQRQIGPDTKDFTRALKYIFRQDPDVVLIGEMRDLETIASAITIAETGHLVFATLHTNSAVQTIDRIIDVFPTHQQSQIRTQLAFILQGVLSQQLIPCRGGGRILALEIMIPSQAIRTLIREGKTHQIYAQMQMGQEESEMVTLNQSLAIAVKQEKITFEQGLYLCSNAEEYTDLVKGR